LIFLLHGYGDSHESYFDEAEEWARLGFVAVAVPGSLPARPGAFIWSEDDVTTTHRQLQAIVGSRMTF
jgi:predicted esterase